MQPLFPWFKALSLALSIIIIIAVLSLYELPFNNLIWSEVQNVGHIFAFGFLSILILKLLNCMANFGRAKLPYNYLYALILSLLLGIITELLQIPGARDADPLDVLRDLIGVVVFLTVNMAMDKNLARQLTLLNEKKRLLIFSALILLIISLTPALLKGYSIIIKYREFPTICDFNSSWDRYFIKARDLNFKRIKLPAEMTNFTDSYVGSICPRQSTYPSLELTGVNKDWTGFDTISFVVYSNSDENIPLYLRINDEEHDNTFADRFNQKLLVKKGVNNFNIPLTAIENAPQSRKMDMKNIESIIIFFFDYKKSWVLYIDDIKLQKSLSPQIALRQ